MEPRDPRVQQMIDDPETYFREARAKAREQVQEAIREEAALRRRLRAERRRRWCRRVPSPPT